jgi:RNA recognition motif-containing protein
MSNRLFVGNLSFNNNENDLQDAFAAHGTVLEANLMTDRTSGRSRGFGFVTMSTPDEAQKGVSPGYCGSLSRFSWAASTSP